MKVNYINHMGDDLQIVNAARVSFGKKSEWEVVTEQIAPNVFEATQHLSKADQGLISFLARGCTSGDWEELLKTIESSSVRANWGGENEEQCSLCRDELEGYVNYVRKMPDHWTPFGHTAITLHIKAPIFVARQLGKHQVGFVWNEVSRRYVTDQPEFYVPDTWRKAAENVKQGSSEEEVTMIDFGYEKLDPREEYIQWTHQAIDEYSFLIQSGVCPEQARMVLPQSMYTEWYWTGNLYGFANVYNQRTDPHAQKEVRDVAHQIGEIIEPLFPYSWKELTK